MSWLTSAKSSVTGSELTQLAVPDSDSSTCTTQDDCRTSDQRDQHAASLLLNDVSRDQPASEYQPTIHPHCQRHHHKCIGARANFSAGGA